MTHLLAMSLGPVQDFIFAARRTRDLWYGSHILSEVSKAAARALAPFGATLIFPPEPPGDQAISNIILAEVAGIPQDAAKAAKKAATDRWLDETKKALQGHESFVDSEIWNAQAADVIEFNAAWVRLTDYRKDRKDLMRILAGRKALRNFEASPVRAMGIPKSSLDGARESVWDQSLLPELIENRKLRLNRGEQLDVIGFTKRLAEWKPYASVSRIAADPWLRGLKATVRRKLIDACGLFKEDVLMPCQWHQFKETFPFDGTIVYTNRHEEYRKANPEATRHVREILKPLPKPNPYYALITADGDRMGGVISELSRADDHRELSRLLAGFSGRVREIAERHFGVYVFSGGDDVLILIPVDQIISCAASLKREFDNALKPVLDKHSALNAPDRKPSLSMGIAIGHFMEPLEDVLRWARDAEKHAKRGFHGDSTPKPERNAIAIHLHTRGGSPVIYRRQWTENPTDRLEHFARGYRKDLLPDRAAFSLRRMSVHLGGWSDSAACGLAMRNEALLLLDRKKQQRFQDLFGSLERDIKKLESPDDLALLTDEMLIARHIANVMKQSEATT